MPADQMNRGDGVKALHTGCAGPVEYSDFSVDIDLTLGPSAEFTAEPRAPRFVYVLVGPSTKTFTFIDDTGTSRTIHAEYWVNKGALPSAIHTIKSTTQSGVILGVIW